MKAIELIEVTYIIDSLDIEGENTQEKVENLFKTFEEEYGHNIKRYTTLQDCLAAWLGGLPSCINIDFTDYNIAQIGKAWGYIKTEADEGLFVRDWFKRIAKGLLKIKEIYDSLQ